MAPMTGRVSNGQKDRTVSAFRLLERFFTPRLPMDRLVGMLEEIGAGGVRETVFHELSLENRLL